VIWTGFGEPIRRDCLLLDDSDPDRHLGCSRRTAKIDGADHKDSFPYPYFDGYHGMDARSAEEMRETDSCRTGYAE